MLKNGIITLVGIIAHIVAVQLLPMQGLDTVIAYIDPVPVLPTLIIDTSGISNAPLASNQGALSRGSGSSAGGAQQLLHNLGNAGFIGRGTNIRGYVPSGGGQGSLRPVPRHNLYTFPRQHRSRGSRGEAGFNRQSGGFPLPPFSSASMRMSLSDVGGQAFPRRPNLSPRTSPARRGTSARNLRALPGGGSFDQRSSPVRPHISNSPGGTPHAVGRRRLSSSFMPDPISTHRGRNINIPNSGSNSGISVNAAINLRQSIFLPAGNTSQASSPHPPSSISDPTAGGTNYGKEAHAISGSPPSSYSPSDVPPYNPNNLQTPGQSQNRSRQPASSSGQDLVFRNSNRQGAYQLLTGSDTKGPYKILRSSNHLSLNQQTMDLNAFPLSSPTDAPSNFVPYSPNTAPEPAQGIAPSTAPFGSLNTNSHSPTGAASKKHPPLSPGSPYQDSKPHQPATGKHQGPPPPHLGGFPAHDPVPYQPASGKHQGPSAQSPRSLPPHDPSQSGPYQPASRKHQGPSAPPPEGFPQRDPHQSGPYQPASGKNQGPSAPPPGGFPPHDPHQYGPYQQAYGKHQGPSAPPPGGLPPHDPHQSGPYQPASGKHQGPSAPPSGGSPPHDLHQSGPYQPAFGKHKGPSAPPPEAFPPHEPHQTVPYQPASGRHPGPSAPPPGGFPPNDPHQSRPYQPASGKHQGPPAPPPGVFPPHDPHQSVPYQRASGKHQGPPAPPPGGLPPHEPHQSVPYQPASGKHQGSLSSPPGGFPVHDPAPYQPASGKHQGHPAPFPEGFPGHDPHQSGPYQPTSGKLPHSPPGGFPGHNLQQPGPEQQAFGKHQGPPPPPPDGFPPHNHGQSVPYKQASGKHQGPPHPGGFRGHDPHQSGPDQQASGKHQGPPPPPGFFPAHDPHQSVPYKQASVKYQGRPPPPHGGIPAYAPHPAVQGPHQPGPGLPPPSYGRPNALDPYQEIIGLFSEPLNTPSGGPGNIVSNPVDVGRSHGSPSAGLPDSGLNPKPPSASSPSGRSIPNTGPEPGSLQIPVGGPNAADPYRPSYQLGGVSRTNDPFMWVDSHGTGLVPPDMHQPAGGLNSGVTYLSPRNANPADPLSAFIPGSGQGAGRPVDGDLYVSGTAIPNYDYAHNLNAAKYFGASSYTRRQDVEPLNSANSATASSPNGMLISLNIHGPSGASIQVMGPNHASGLGGVGQSSTAVGATEHGQAGQNPSSSTSVTDVGVGLQEIAGTVPGSGAAGTGIVEATEAPDPANAVASSAKSNTKASSKTKKANIDIKVAKAKRKTAKGGKSNTAKGGKSNTAKGGKNKKTV